MNLKGNAARGQAICTSQQAAILLAKVAELGDTLRLEVREDRAFDEGLWLDLGEVKPLKLSVGEWGQEIPLSENLANGQFAWTVPSEPDLRDGLFNVIPDLKDKPGKGADASTQKRQNSALKALTETMQDVARRLGLLHPCFALDCLSQWPYKRPATWILDTSAIAQGAADFGARVLFPMVRFRVPAVANVEILTMCDNFKGLWDSRPDTTAKKVNLLKEHLKSQGAQRCLMRLEWQSSAEIERATVGSDPLRFVFKNDDREEVKGLGLTTIQRSLADRLIFETAKEHRNRMSPGQPVFVVTSDGGMARMALTEGMNPVFFHARSGGSPLGRRLTGTLHHPFIGHIYTISLIEVLWELASCFGMARLRLPDGNAEFGAMALSSTFQWSPDHVKNNLFVCFWQRPEEKPTPVIEIRPVTFSSNTQSKENEAGSGFGISAKMLLNLLEHFAPESTIPQEYRLFLKSGNFITAAKSDWQVLPSFQEFRAAFIHCNREELVKSLMQVPSFRTFKNYAEESGRRLDWKDSCPIQRGQRGYRDLSEICGLAWAIPDKGLCATLTRPSLEEFTSLAFQRYKELSELGTSQWVETGKWLEILAWEDGIAPIITRDLLEEAFEANLLERAFEGSTPDVSFEEHTLMVLECNDGKPVLKRYYIYRGDFLRSPRASVRLSLSLKRP